MSLARNPSPATWAQLEAALQPLDQELALLSEAVDRLRRACVASLSESNAALYHLDFMVIGATKRTQSLESGLRSMIGTKNMLCARAIVRMQVDTVCRLMAYTDVENPLDVARKVWEGVKLNKFKSISGKPLTDGYLVDRLSEGYSWIRTIYDSTTAEVHFTEKQFFSSVKSIEPFEREGRTLNIEISPNDAKYPESSWAELPACLRHLCEIQIDFLARWSAEKTALRVKSIEV
ncbi:MAG: hypothetical protein JSR72_23205 [Proteobacteria bacterium]|nr:hypothetical protein [Pseudomonadota bacterium]